MRSTRTPSLRGLVVVLAVLAVGSVFLGGAWSGPAVVQLGGEGYRVTGPYTHENVAVYLVHSPNQDPREFITLDQGLREGVVQVSEQAQAQVRELVIDNQSDRYLFLQEGDRLRGGQQDRTIFASFVVPPRSGKMPLPAFCIEPSRWVVADLGGKFTNTSNAAFATKEVRLAAKVVQDQGTVWESVRRQKEATEGFLQVNHVPETVNKTSSLNEALDAPQIKRISDEFATALSGVLQGQPDAVGVAIAVNGKIEEVNIYPNHALLAQQYPRLVQSYALEATLGTTAANVPAPSALDVAHFMAASDRHGGLQSEDVVAANVSQRVNINEPLQAAGFINDIPGRPVELMWDGPVNLDSNGGQVFSGNRAAMTGRGRRLVNRTTGQFAPVGMAAVRAESINPHNRLEVREGGAAVACTTEFNGKAVHRQFMSRSQPAAARPSPAARAAMPNPSAPHPPPQPAARP
jgi:hypothetical protein